MYSDLEKYKVYSEKLQQEVVPYTKVREFVDTLVTKLNTDIDQKLEKAYREINKAIENIQNI